MIKLSVLLLTYNHVKYIEECIQGIINQKVNFEIEILVGDDESSDGTTEIVEKYLNIDRRIRLLRGKREEVIYVNGEATGKKNFVNLLKNAKGKYIAICEGDDYWIDNNKLQMQVDFMENNEEYGICYTNSYIRRNEEFIKHNKETGIRTTFTIEDLIKENFIMTNTVVIRNNFNYELLPQWFFEVSIVCDWLLYVIIIKNKKIKYINYVTGVYRIHENGTYSAKGDAYRIIDVYNILNAFNNYFNYKYNEIISEKKSEILLYIENKFSMYKEKTKLIEYLTYNEEQLFNYICKNLKNNNIYIWGAGTHTKNLIDLLKKYNFDFCNIQGIIDGSIIGDSEQYKLGIKTISKNTFLEKYKFLCSDIIISSASFEEEIYKEICDLKINEDINIIKLYEGDRKNQFKVLV